MKGIPLSHPCPSLRFALAGVFATALGASMAASGQLQGTAAPSVQQVAAIVARATQNQHRDDAALEEYAYTERIVSRLKTGGTSEKISRVVPHGTGNFRVELSSDGVPAPAASIETHWREIAEALASYSNPANQQRVKQDREKAAKEKFERDQLEDLIGKAFLFHWVGRTMREQRPVVELSFEPDPAFKPTVRFSNLYSHIRGTAWVDEASGRVAYVEAEFFEDIPFVGGLVAKLDRGGNLGMEQAEVTPDVWAPTHFSVEIDGRKFLFAFSMHEQISFSSYLRVGQPHEALAAIERDHPGLSRGAH